MYFFCDRFCQKTDKLEFRVTLAGPAVYQTSVLATKANLAQISIVFAKHTSFFMLEPYTVWKTSIDI